VDREHNLPGSRVLAPNPIRVYFESRRMDQRPSSLGPVGREIVLRSIQEVCSHRNWNLIAAHVLSNHLHVIVEGVDRPEKIMNALKSYASRALNHQGIDPTNRKRWSRHGSTRWLWNDRDVDQAARYVVDEQSEPMALFMAARDT